MSAPSDAERCVRDVWWVDPVGAILISCYIVWSWVSIAKEQMNQMVRPKSYTHALYPISWCCALHLIFAQRKVSVHESSIAWLYRNKELKSSFVFVGASGRAGCVRGLHTISNAAS